MGTLTPEEARSRAGHDGAGAAAINASGFPVRVSGYHAAADATAQRNEVPLVGHHDPPTVFRMRCDFPTLERPGVALRGATYVVDTTAGGDYPGTEPVSRIVTTPVPFAPHIGTSGAVCHGHFVWVAWRTQLPDYLAQLCRLLNYDEPPPAGGFSVMNPAALRHWVSIGHRPLDPRLGSPLITLDAPSTRRVMRRAALSAPPPRTLRKASR